MNPSVPVPAPSLPAEKLWGAPLFAALLTVALAVPLLSQPYNFDHAVFATVADGLLHGGTLYQDAWDLKPPAIYAVFYLSALLLGQDMWAVRAVEILSLALYSAGLVVLVRRRLRSTVVGFAAALVSTGLYLSFAATCEGKTAQAESFQFPFWIWALCLWPLPDESGDLRARCFAAGALMGILVLFKTTAALLLFGLLLDRMVLDRSKSSWRGRLALTALTLAGTLAPVIATLGLFAAVGALSDFLDANVWYPSRYLLLHGDQQPVERLARFLDTPVRIMPGPWWILLGAGIWRGFRTDRDETLRWLMVTLTAWASVAIQLKFLDYHHLPLIPPLSVLAAMAFLPRPAGRWSSKDLSLAFSAVLLMGALSFAASTSTFWGGYGQVVRRRPPDRYWVGRASTAGPQEVADFVRQRTEKSDRILVWGNEPLIYCLSDRRMAGKYTQLTHMASPWYPPSHTEAMLLRIERDRPRLVIVCSGDGLWDLPDGLESLEERPVVRAYLDRYFEELPPLGRYRIWQREGLE